MTEEEEQEQQSIEKLLGTYTGGRNAQEGFIFYIFLSTFVAFFLFTYYLCTLSLERHGYGENHFPNGDIYKGHYETGVRQGEGKYYWKTPGAVYQGNYANHKKEGHGLMRYPDGSVYEGDFHEGKRHGVGKYTYPNGDTYEGDWHQGKKHGKGVFTMNKDGSTVCYIPLYHFFCLLFFSIVHRYLVPRANQAWCLGYKRR